MLPRIEIWAMDLPERNQFTLSGGWKQDRARALFTALLPPGDTCYTAAEVVKTALPDRKHHDLYVAHYRALDSLARKHGISDGAFPGPDNVDGTGKRLPGKKPGHLQPCRWHRDHWLGIISDEIYEWLRGLNQTLAELAANSPPNTRFWCDLETFKITVEKPLDSFPVKVAVKKSLLEVIRIQSSSRIVVGLSGLAIIIFLALNFWHHYEIRTKPSPPSFYNGMPSDAELALDFGAYIKASCQDVTPMVSTPHPATDTWASQWEADPKNMLFPEMPPSTLLASDFF